jgi:hypothetical protein
VPAPSGQNIRIEDVRRTESGRRPGGTATGSDGGLVTVSTAHLHFENHVFIIEVLPNLAPLGRTPFTKGQVKQIDTQDSAVVFPPETSNSSGLLKEYTQNQNIPG